MKTKTFLFMTVDSSNHKSSDIFDGMNLEDAKKNFRKYYDEEDGGLVITEWLDIYELTLVETGGEKIKWMIY